MRFFIIMIRFFSIMLIFFSFLWWVVSILWWVVFPIWLIIKRKSWEIQRIEKVKVKIDTDLWLMTLKIYSFEDLAMDVQFVWNPIKDVGSCVFIRIVTDRLRCSCTLAREYKTNPTNWDGLGYCRRVMNSCFSLPAPTMLLTTRHRCIKWVLDLWQMIKSRLKLEKIELFLFVLVLFFDRRF